MNRATVFKKIERSKRVLIKSLKNMSITLEWKCNFLMKIVWNFGNYYCLMKMILMVNSFWEMDKRPQCVNTYTQSGPWSDTPPTSRHIISVYRKLI